MFKWLASLFTTLTSDIDRPYVIYMRGTEVARSVSMTDAEEWILEIFENTDNNHVGGRRFGTHCNTSKSYRRKQFRGQCTITKLCTTCGHKAGYCGQY
jgi:hypothetical protein